MRASRLVELLLLLQTRGRLSARELSGLLEVSVRTVHRDVEALAAAGVPVYADRGRHGGYRLLDGYRTRLTGLTPDEARALLLAGTPDRAAQGLGLGDVLAATQLKLLAALPPAMREQAAQVRERFHLDPSGWEYRPSEPEHLPVVVAALWDQRRLAVTYRRWGPQDVDRVLEPLGVVLKVGNWYLVARAPSGIRTYNVARMLSARALDEPFERPAGFDLATSWEESQAGYADRVYRHWVDVRISPAGLDRLPLIGAHPARRAREAAGPPDGAGWVRTRIPLETQRHAETALLRLGPELEVLGPPQLRARMAEQAAGLAALYADGASGPR